MCFRLENRHNENRGRGTWKHTTGQPLSHTDFHILFGGEEKVLSRATMKTPSRLFSFLHLSPSRKGGEGGTHPGRWEGTAQSSFGLVRDCGDFLESAFPGLTRVMHHYHTAGKTY